MAMLRQPKAKAKNHTRDARRVSKVSKDERHLKALKEARREWRKLLDRQREMRKLPLDPEQYTEYLKAGSRVEELEKIVIEHNEAKAFEHRLDVAVFKGRFVYECYERERRFPKFSNWYLAFELCILGDYGKSER